MLVNIIKRAQSMRCINYDAHNFRIPKQKSNEQTRSTILHIAVARPSHVVIGDDPCLINGWPVPMECSVGDLCVHFCLSRTITVDRSSAAANNAPYKRLDNVVVASDKLIVRFGPSKNSSIAFDSNAGSI